MTSTGMVAVDPNGREKEEERRKNERGKWLKRRGSIDKTNVRARGREDRPDVPESGCSSCARSEDDRVLAVSSLRFSFLTHPAEDAVLIFIHHVELLLVQRHLLLGVVVVRVLLAVNKLRLLRVLHVSGILDNIVALGPCRRREESKNEESEWHCTSLHGAGQLTVSVCVSHFRNFDFQLYIAVSFQRLM